MRNFLVTLITLVMSIFIFISPASAIPEFSKLDAPSSTIPVRVAIHITTITEISSVSESWSTSGYLIYEWNDLKVKDGLYELDKIWHPGLEMVNMISNDVSDSIATVKGGLITVQERFTTELSAQMEFEKFPFDSQKLEIDIESLRDAGVFLIPGKFTISNDGFTALSEWRIEGTDIKKSSSFFPPENAEYSRLMYILNVRRNGGFFVNKIIIPIVLLTIASFTSLWVPTNELGTATSINMTTGLSTLTLWLISADALVKTSVVSILDNVIFISLFTNVLVFFFVIGLFNKGSRTAFLPSNIKRLVRIGLPLVYFMLITKVLCAF